MLSSATERRKQKLMNSCFGDKSRIINNWMGNFPHLQGQIAIGLQCGSSANATTLHFDHVLQQCLCLSYATKVVVTLGGILGRIMLVVPLSPMTKMRFMAAENSHNK